METYNFPHGHEISTTQSQIYFSNYSSEFKIQHTTEQNINNQQYSIIPQDFFKFILLKNETSNTFEFIYVSLNKLINNN